MRKPPAGAPVGLRTYFFMRSAILAERCAARGHYCAGGGAAGAAGAFFFFCFSIVRLIFLRRLLSDLVFLRREWTYGSPCTFFMPLVRSLSILPTISMRFWVCLSRSSIVIVPR